MSIRKSIVALSLALPALSVFAWTHPDIVRSVPLKDGSTMHQFKDGKMAIESRYGRAISVKEGSTLETMDGKTITMVGNEIGRLYPILPMNIGAG